MILLSVKKLYENIHFRLLKFFKKGIRMAVLGMDQSGKTSFSNFLKDGDPGKPNQTAVSENISPYYFKNSEGKYFFIEKGEDIAGTKDVVFRFYEEKVKNNKLILFLFNSLLFYENTDYRLDVVDRIALISEKIYAVKNNANIQDLSPKIFFIVPTWKDKLFEKGIQENEFMGLLLNSLYEDSSASCYSNREFIKPLSQTNNIESLQILKDSIFRK